VTESGFKRECILFDDLYEFSELLDDKSSSELPDNESSLEFFNKFLGMIIGSKVFSPHVNNAPLLNSTSNAFIFPNFTI